MRKLDFTKYQDRHYFYRTKEWLAVRQVVLHRDKFCKICSTEDNPVPATEVDHIIDLSKRPDLCLTLSNLQGLCQKCHAKKTFDEHLRGKWEKTKDIKILNRKWNLNFQNTELCSTET